MNNDGSSSENQKSWFPDVLVLGPGGIKGFLQLGALFVLSGGGYFEQIKTYVGVSVGAIISLLLVANFSVKQIITVACDTNLFQDLSTFNIKDIKNNIGLISNEPIRKKLVNLLTEKWGFVPTFKQLYTITGLKLVTVTLNLDHEDGIEYMSYITEPNLSCVDAVMFSMNIPFLLYKIKYKNCTYVDGGLGNPYPIEPFDNGINNVLGIHIESNYPGKSDNADSNHGIYFNRVIQSSTRQLKKRILAGASNKCKHIALYTSNLDTTGLTINADIKASMIIEGYKKAKEFISQLEEKDNKETNEISKGF